MEWSVTSGILQPFDATHVIYNPFIPRFTNQEIRFYPVPTPNIVYIDFRSRISGKISIQLISRDGKLLGYKRVCADRREQYSTMGSDKQVGRTLLFPHIAI